jgi:hypothetical protein
LRHGLYLHACEMGGPSLGKAVSPLNAMIPQASAPGQYRRKDDSHAN